MMSRKRTFDPGVVPLAFWHRDDVCRALACREAGRLFGIYLAAFPACTQTQLALLTGHDRSDISNFVRGVRSPRVTDIDVLHRIADGLALPDTARAMLGLSSAGPVVPEVGLPVPAEIALEATITGWFLSGLEQKPPRVAICGSRSSGCDTGAVDGAVRALGRLLISRQCEIDHGPMGIGIEIMTHIADRYRPPNLRAAVGVFGRSNVVRHADFVLIVGGGSGTLDEVDLALSMGKRIIPFAGSGGAAQLAADRLAGDVDSRTWMPPGIWDTLRDCQSADSYARIVGQLFEGTTSHE